MEIHLVGDLQDLGYHAVSALQEYGPKAFEKMDAAAVINQLKNTGVDALITMVLLNKTRENNYFPALVQDSPMGYFYSRFSPYQLPLYKSIHEPGYYFTNTEYSLETNLYDLRNQKLVYSIQTKIFDPISAEGMGHQQGQLVVKDLVKQHLLSKASTLVNARY